TCYVTKIPKENSIGLVVGTTRRMELEMSKMRSTSLDTIKGQTSILTSKWLSRGNNKENGGEIRAEDSCNSMATLD
ncbi:hypothetical protein MTR67_018865, partial [Solanum verrucosum]